MGRGRVGQPGFHLPASQGAESKTRDPKECAKYLGGGGVPKERKGGRWTGRGGKRKSLPRFLGGTGKPAGTEGAGT